MEPNELPKSENNLRRHPFTVPDGYFNNLPMQIQQRVQAEQKQAIIFRTLLAPKLRFSALMGIILMLAASVWFVLREQQQSVNNVQQVSIAQLSDNEIFQYLTSEEAGLETNDLALMANLEDEQLPVTLPAYNAQDIEQELELSDIEDYYL